MCFNNWIVKNASCKPSDAAIQDVRNFRPFLQTYTSMTHTCTQIVPARKQNNSPSTTDTSTFNQDSMVPEGSSSLHQLHMHNRALEGEMDLVGVPMHGDSTRPTRAGGFMSHGSYLTLKCAFSMTITSSTRVLNQTICDYGSVVLLWSLHVWSLHWPSLGRAYARDKRVLRTIWYMCHWDIVTSLHLPPSSTCVLDS
jgi:hypothetical protein